ncbi:hypothetical protein Aperf_G00000090908 [Anoplocephala perfoliata]
MWSWGGTTEDYEYSERPIALDCEMVEVGPPRQNALARVSIVNYNYKVLLDEYCCPDMQVTNYRTYFSGVRPQNLAGAPPLEVVQNKVQRIIKNRIVVGHAIENDFKVLRLNHPPHLVRDTLKAPYAKKRLGLGEDDPVRLQDLYFGLFDKMIQQDEHSSVEDACATMEIYRLVEKEWETDLGNQIVAQSPEKSLIPSFRTIAIASGVASLLYYFANRSNN